MKRVITSLSLLLLLLCGAYAQDISQYEYWTDDDYASRSVVSSSGGNISLDVSTASLSAGIHFLNFRAKRSDEIWGNYYRYLYYIPTLRSADAGNLKVEYWLDDDLAGVKSETAGSGSLSLSIDISALKPGVHYFNCTPISATGERGNSERYLFYVPYFFDKTATSSIKGIEYWIDDNYSSKKVDQSGSQNPVFTIDIGNLTSGVHYFNCRVYNDRGEYGDYVRELFYIPVTKASGDAKLATYEYWLDDDYAHCVKGNSANTDQAFTIDVSKLSSGVHYFNYWPIDDKGQRGNVIRQLFYMAKVAQSASEEIEYEYWIDTDTEHKVTGKGKTGDLAFNIDVSGLEKGSHTFNFRAKYTQDQWGDLFIENFTISTEPQEVVTITANDLTMVYGGEVPDLTYTVTGGKLTGQPKLATTATKTSPVGTYSISIEKGSVSNEHFNLVPGKLTIMKAPLTVTAKSYTRAEGQENPVLELTYSGWKNNETEAVLIKKPTATTTANAQSAPGTYPIIVNGGEAQNYDFTYVNGTLTVTASDMITIIADNVSMVYGDELPKLTYKVTGGELTGQPKLSTTATKTSSVGTYPITVEVGTVTNKRVTFVAGTLTITKAPLKIKIDNAEMTEGENLPSFVITYEGFKNGETESVLTKKPVVTTTVTKQSPPGEYTLSVSGAEAQNYEITYVSGKLTVKKKAVNYGDANGDGVIDISDLVVTINVVMGGGSPYDERMDMNHDGEINVADIILIKRAILYGNNSRAKARTNRASSTTVSLSEFTALQYVMTVSDHMLMENLSLLGNNKKTHQIEYHLIGEESYRVIIYSMTNQLFEPVNGALLELNYGSGENEYTISNVIAVKPSGEKVELNELPDFISTGIQEIISMDGAAPYDVYDIRGVKVLSAGDSLKGLKRGMYIINRKKTAIK